jgi:hypothetical protein
MEVTLIGSLVLAVLVENSGGNSVKFIMSGGEVELGGGGGGPSRELRSLVNVGPMDSGVRAGAGGTAGSVEPSGRVSSGTLSTGIAGGMGAEGVGAMEGDLEHTSESDTVREGTTSCPDGGGARGWSRVAVIADVADMVGGVTTREGRELVWMYFMISGIGSSSSLSKTGSLRRRSSRNSFLITLYLLV